MEILQPVQGVGHQEIAHLRAAEVEDVGAPVELLAAARVGVLVECGAVEAAESPIVLGEVRRNPIHDDADPGAVQAVHQVPEVVRGAEPRRRRIVGRDLVPP